MPDLNEDLGLLDEIMEAEDRIYNGPVEINMVFAAPDNDGKPLRRIRILAEHPDGGWIHEELPSKMIRWAGEIRRIPNYNLRRVFRPEDSVSAE